ncbi:SlyX family protein [uncultured Cocleimonas sp.]|uniref:SlyX family protein n=1 Tax=uncultured Cocleimonas sp. TaxID=1051587 RepID=UPI0026064A0B|nr:SlyX family protein [uncultured Cocleimonas sp.]
MEKRLENLEMLSMEQDNTIETLNREVHRQQLQINILIQHIELLKTQIQSINKEDLLVSEEDENPPPHY